MLNKDNARELCYLARVDDIKPIEGRDRVECAVVGGWTLMVRKDDFKPGDIGIYFEVDSRTPETPPFEFLASKKYKIKVQKYKTPSGQFWSQGLLMHPKDFNWTVQLDGTIKDNKGKIHNVNDESRFLTKQLGVIYADDEDNERKGVKENNTATILRHKKLLKKFPFRQLMCYSWTRSILLSLLGRKKKKKCGWPSHIAAKTDVERLQNAMFILQDKSPYVATEKVDGASFSAMAEIGKFGKITYYCCSRNVVFKDPNQKCFYDKNVYFEMFEEYHLKDILTKLLKDYNLQNVAIQSELFGDGIQKRDYSMKNGHHEIRVFHIVSSGVKFPMDKVVEICDKYGLPHVPVVNDNYIFPDTIEEVQEYVEGAPSLIDGLPKEGIVFYDKETGQRYVKFVSPEFLLKYHS